jgi:hypothetical protein
MLTSSSGGGGPPNKAMIGSSGSNGLMNHHPLMSAPAFNGDEPGASDFEDIWNTNREYDSRAYCEIRRSIRKW